ncbi:UNVERIFIED_CONTAM: YebC/PmpR family DNA-binding transcriptional regulator, partial [Salmonella enterica subsp. enterica serovar Weltevreden]
ADVVRRPANTVAVAGEQAESLQKLIDMLEDLDDVQKVYSNAELPA